MRLRTLLTLRFFGIWVVLSCFAYGFTVRLAARPQNDNVLQRARETLKSSAHAYQQVVALKDVLTYTVTTPSAVLAPKTLEITLGERDQVALKDPLIEAVAVDGSLFVTKSDAPGKYVVQPYSGDFAKVLDAVVGEQGWPLEPLQIAMRLGKGVDAWLTALRFKQLAPLQISGYEKRSDNVGSFDEIHFRAENGWLDADFDSLTHFLSRVSFEAHPFGAPKDVFIRVLGECSPKVLANARGLVSFDPNGKVAVADLASLDAAQLPTGKPAPSVELKNLAGGSFSWSISGVGGGARFLGLLVRALLEKSAGIPAPLRLGIPEWIARYGSSHRYNGTISNRRRDTNQGDRVFQVPKA